MNSNPATWPWVVRVDGALRRRIVVTIGFLTVVAIGITLFGFRWQRGLAASPDGVTTDTGARVGVIGLLLVLIAGLAVSRLKLRNSRFLLFVPGAVTLGFTSVAGLLFATNRLDFAYGLYGGLQVLRSDKLFSDTHWVLSWFECNFCERWDPHYGPTLAWLEPITAGGIGLGWLLPIGVGLVSAAVVSSWILAAPSSSTGRWVLILASLSPAWLLLVDRANADLVILGSCVVGAWFVARQPALLSWSLYASGLWVLGTIKYFPFAMGVLLLFALGVRRGWWVIIGFLVASIGYVLVAWDSYIRSSEWNATAILVLGDFPAYGRIQTVDLLVGLDGASGTQALVVVMLVVLVLTGFVMGYGSTHVPPTARDQILVGALALSGSVAFLGKVLWGGFGFMYSGAFLLLAVPVIVTSPKGAGWRNGMNAAAALLLLLAVFSAYNTVLATVTGVAFAGFALGAGLRIAFAYWQGVEYRVEKEAL